MSSDRSLIRISDSDSAPDIRIGSHERTNERTYGEVGSGRQSGNGSRRERVYEEIDNGPTRISDTLGDFLDTWELRLSRTRHEVTRKGERAPISTHVRDAVWFRDHGRCSECLPEWQRDEPMHLDHIVPWSAGGSDTTDNLRLLCETHNLERSNYVDFAQPRRPATWWCANCYALDVHVWQHIYPFVVCPRHGSQGPNNSWCRVGRAYARAFQRGDERPTWHERPLLTSFDQIAYCAHCDAPGMTGVVL